MFDHNKAIFELDWQTLIKAGVGIIVVFYIFETICSLYLFNDVIDTTSGILSRQESQLKNLNLDADAEVKRTQDGMTNGVKEMQAGAKHLEDKLTNFANDFNDSLQAELDKMAKRHQQEYISEFLEKHVDYYDSNLYNADRNKSIAETKYPIPDYKQYVVLREAAIQCHVKLHNQQEETIYRNDIARLKAEQKTKVISSLPKPDYWKWPLTTEQWSKITTEEYRRLFILLTPEGQCRNV